MTTTGTLQWSQVVAKGAGMKVITPSRAPRDGTMTSDILYEHSEFTRQQLSRKAAALVKQALTPQSVLFSLPHLAFERRSKAYAEIESQIGEVQGFRHISAYDVRSRRDMLIEAKFVNPDHATKAIEEGITVNEVIYKASPTVSGSENPLIRVQLSLLHIDSDQAIRDGLLSSLRYYGKVYQIRRILYDGYFEGQLTVTIDPSEGYEDSKGEHHEAQPLQRMLYLETWDTFAPASFKGAAPVCYYCRQAGHIRNNCPELARRVCFECGVAGHTRKFCKAKVTDTQAIDLYEQAKSQKTEQETQRPVKDVDQTTKATSEPVISDTEDQKGVNDDLSDTEATIDEEVEKEDEDIEMDEVPKKSRLDDVDPEFSINSSKHAPYDKATRMKLDEEEPAEEVHLVTATRTSTGKRSILKNKQPSMSPRVGQNFDLELDPVVPSPPPTSDIAQHTPTTQRSFIYDLRTSHDLDILCLQETATNFSHPHITEEQVHSFTTSMFPNRSSIITKHAAIVCLRQDLTLANAIVSMDERIIVASVLDPQQHLVCNIINTYIPATRTARPDFLRSFLSLPFIQEVDGGPWFLLGDFNLHLHDPTVTGSPAIQPWYDWIRTHFDNCMPAGLPPTFQRGDSRSTIDYIFGHHSMMTRVTNANQHFLPTSLTDHCLLTIDLLPVRQDFGRGSWRFNPSMLYDEKFVTLLDHNVASFFETIDSTPDVTPQEQWESLKRLLKYTAQRQSRGSTAHRRTRIAKLQAERQQLLVNPTNKDLATIEQQIDTLIQHDTRQTMLRSATRWHEQGERNNKYFFRVIRERQAQHTITALKGSDFDGVLTDIHDIIKETRKFYSQLYTPEDVDLSAMDSLLQNIPSTVTLSAEDSKELIALPHPEDILDLVDHAPAGKSPGLDGIPFEVYKHLVPRSPRLRHLLLTIIRQAMEGIFPPSWSHTRMVLLFKKGDPELLRNWRPLSLINTDAKLFTKLLANRFNQVLPKLINPYQTGFMPHRLISDNGWINQVIMHNQSTACKMDPTVAVFLDQEKAYDRVHPEYLRRVMAHFGFPPSIIQSLSCLFFNTQVHVSINGHLGKPFTQSRGLRQGDPLSPLLFNIVFEPLLRSILASPLSGVSLASIPSRSSTRATPHPLRNILPAPPAIKLLSYADDLEVFLSHTGEWPILMDLLQRYGAASNAKVNLSKTILMSLSGTAHTDWQPIAQTYGAQWHDATSTDAVRYLGYPLYHTANQLASFLDSLKLKLLRHANILKERRLSLRGASTVANSLLLSRLWHVLRVTPMPHEWLLDMKSIVLSFIAPFWPKPAWATLCLPRRYGGVGVVDIIDQSQALHLIYLQRMCDSPRPSDFITPWIVRYYQLLTGHSSLLPWFLFPSQVHQCLKLAPHMAHLGKVLCRLPQLTPSSSWSARWFLDVPLRFFKFPTSGSPPKTLSLQHLLSDLVHWDLRQQQLFFSPTAPSRKAIRQIRSSFDPTLAPCIISVKGHDSTQLRLHFPTHTSPPDMITYQPVFYTLPTLTHWEFHFSPTKRRNVPYLSLSELRLYWHPYWQHINDDTSRPTESVPRSLTYPQSFWRRFWRLSLPHKALTPWWRLLQHCIATQQKRHRFQLQHVDDSVCPLCKIEEEDIKHMFVSCSTKRPFWRAALQYLQLDPIFPTQDLVWQALTTFLSRRNRPLCDNVLRRLGCIVAVLWQHHWRCRIDDQAWITATVLDTLQSDLLYSSFVPPTPFSDQ
ncbi:hypothetical protein O0I10_009643 [Lichtheimia ornata]|uniref:Reverse transcriptase n=1 Tax=Lichtheimia ornata TaxID=688661 RepID=A0AAD7UXZ6_9FUNG|nr:uncharacterized protein O0I10_009643 [Lichtheimia ornata]KAJ8654752.1 hypothetical protein O0I10_009643 [Lichtheimia ornata]